MSEYEIEVQHPTNSWIAAMMSVKNCVETNEKGAAVKATYTMKMKGRFRSTSETVANHAVATPRDDGKNGP
ncbi:hypothetical protein HZH66_014673 [Vespula vulgaris]|uniref:Uncharacterized protein n=1 Tax=Vespula vulgaris TaxID=7454 RepID=A0A834J1U4_VESVU|nr:hypothetical protein HZH66_014673 [Vespula vulgaris]